MSGRKCDQIRPPSAPEAAYGVEKEAAKAAIARGEHHSVLKKLLDLSKRPR